jgi:hypothetical protein
VVDQDGGDGLGLVLAGLSVGAEGRRNGHADPRRYRGRWRRGSPISRRSTQTCQTWTSSERFRRSDWLWTPGVRSFHVIPASAGEFHRPQHYRLPGVLSSDSRCGGRRPDIRGAVHARTETWVKPSFLWMMYRSGWATTPGQERILPARSPARRPGRGQRAAGRVPGVGRRAVGRDGAGLAELRRRTPNPPTVGQPRGRRHSRHRRHLRPWNLMVSVTSSTTPFALARPILSSQTVQSYPVTRLNSAENTASAAGSYSSSPSRWSSDSTSSLYPHRARKPPRWPDDPSG